MHCTLPWNGLALQIRRFEMPPLCKLAMWHFCVRQKGHSTCWILPNLEKHTCSSHPHMCTSALITLPDSPEVSRPLYIEAIMCGVDSTYLLRPSSVHKYIFAIINMSFEVVWVHVYYWGQALTFGRCRRGLLWPCASLLSSPLIITQWLCFNALLWIFNISLGGLLF